MKLKDLFYIFSVLMCVQLIFITEYAAVPVSCIILLTYFVYRPNYILHPNNVIFAFSFLYVVLPSSIFYCFEIYQIGYILPWGKLFDWSVMSKSTFIDMVFIFLIPYWGFRSFTVNDRTFALPRYSFHIKKGYVAILTFVLIPVLFIYVNLTGGISAWLNDYKMTYLTKKEGYGYLNLIIMYMSNILVFLLGLRFFQLRFFFNKLVLIAFSISFIMVIAYIQGLKSRLIVLLIIFSFIYISSLHLNITKLVVIGLSFFGVILITTYLRTDGYYTGVHMLTEYMMSYFNTYSLHDSLIKDYDPDLFFSQHQVFVKPLVKIGLLPADTDFDLSVMLTKIYYPLQWYQTKATQQWPLVSELYLNYYGMLLGWVPVLMYTYIISRLYNSMVNGSVSVVLIYILEMMRLFSTYRGVLLPWQLPVFIMFYVLIYFYIKRAVYVDKQNI